MDWTAQWKNLFRSPKSTITGILGAAIAVTLAIMILPPKASIPVTIIAVCRALIDFTKQDAGMTLAVSAADPTQTPKLVPSHEVPDDPAETAAVPKS